MAGIFSTLRSLGRQTLARVSEGAARAVASFAERYDRHSANVRVERAHLPRGSGGRADHAARLGRQHLTGERAFSSMLKGYGGGALGYPGTSWSQNRAVQVEHFRRWIFVGASRICDTIAGLPWKLSYVRPRRKKPRRPGEPGTGTVHKHAHARNRRQRARLAKRRRAFYEARYKKSLHTIHPHEEVEEVGDDHPCARLLKKPNAWDHSPGQIWAELVLFLILTGNAYLWVVPDRAFGKPLELWVIPSQWIMGPRLNAAGKKEYLVMPYVGGYGQFTIPDDEIVHFKFANPLNKIDGWAPIQAIAPWIDVSESVDDSRYWTFKQGTQATGALELGPSYDPDDVDIDAIGAKLIARYQGERNAGQPFILPPDVKMTPLTIAAKDMAFEGGFDQLRDAILAALAVPKGIAGITDPGSDRALWGERAVFMEQAIKPRLKYIGETFTATVCRRWDDELRFYWEDPTPPDPQQINADLGVDYQHGLRAPNEGRAERGLEPLDLPYADEPWVNPQLMPWSLAVKKMEQEQKQAQQAAQAQQQPPPPPSQPPGGGGGAPPGAAAAPADASTFAALAAGDQPESEQQQSQGQDQANAEDAALDVNDQAWKSHAVAVQKASEYNAKAQATGSRWRLEMDAKSQRWRARNLDGSAKKKSADGGAATSKLVAAGLAVVADDTGRALMLQRSLDENGDNGGKWEFPGGHIETGEGESPRDAAVREWQEETGLALPGGAFSGVWNSANGIYRGYVYRVPAESSLDLFDRDPSSNPDGDTFEALAWIDPADMPNHNLRPELLGDLPAVRAALRSVPAGAVVVKALGASVRKTGMWEESKHPRGQPGNAGEFASGSGGGGGGGGAAAGGAGGANNAAGANNTAQQPANAAQQQPAQAPPPAPPPAPSSPPPPPPPPAPPSPEQRQQGTWQERQTARDRTRDALDAADFGGEKAAADAWGKLSQMNDAVQAGTADEAHVDGAIKAALAGWGEHWANAEKTLSEAGASEKHIRELANMRKRAGVAIGPKAAAYQKQAGKYLAAHAAMKESAGAEPQEPPEPDYPEEPKQRPDESEDDFGKRYDEWSTVNDKMAASHEKEYDRWSKEYERWDSKHTRASEKVDAEYDRLDERLNDLNETMETYQGALGEHASGVDDTIRERLDHEDSEDTDPETHEEAETEAENGGDHDRSWLTKGWESSKHPRGGNQKNPGQFSHGAGGAGSAPAAAPAAPDATRPYPPPTPPPEPSATRSTRGEVRADGDGPAGAGAADTNTLDASASVSDADAARTPLHRSLATSPFVHGNDLSRGVNKAFLLRLADGTQGVFKPAAGESASTPRGVPWRTGYRREVAASRVADILGMSDLVPATVFRTQRSGVGSMQQYVEGAAPAADMSKQERYDGPEDAARAAALDYVFGNIDRHQGNWLVRDGKLALIDNGFTFPTEHHPHDISHVWMWRNAVDKGLQVPEEAAGWRDRWDDIEAALWDCGLEEPAIALTRQRFDAICGAASKRIADLPAFVGGGTMGEMVRHFGPSKGWT